MTGVQTCALPIFVQSFVELRVLRLLNWRTLSRLTKGIEPGAESSVTKLVWSDMSQALASRALEVLGPAPAPLTRMRGEHRVQFFIKSTNRTHMRRAVRAALDEVGDIRRRVSIDVDPLNVI